MKALKVYENLEFERGISPKASLGLGWESIINRISDNTRDDAFSGDNYTEKGWKDIIEWMLVRNFEEDEIKLILFSRLMRWAADRSEKPWGKNNLEDFLKYDVGYFLLLLDENLPDSNRKNRIKI